MMRASRNRLAAALLVMKNRLKKPQKGSLARTRRPSTVTAVGIGMAVVLVAQQWLASIMMNGSRWSGHGLGEWLPIVILACQAVVWIWWLLGPIASHSSWRYPLLGKQRWRNTFLHFCFALSFATASVCLYGLLQYVYFKITWSTGASSTMRDVGEAWFIALTSASSFVAMPSLVAYCLLVTITHVGRQERRLA